MKYAKFLTERSATILANLHDLGQETSDQINSTDDQNLDQACFDSGQFLILHIQCLYQKSMDMETARLVLKYQFQGSIVRLKSGYVSLLTLSTITLLYLCDVAESLTSKDYFCIVTTLQG